MILTIAEAPGETWYYHLRDACNNLSAGALCGAAVTWDTGIEPHRWGMKDGPSRWCEECPEIAKKAGALDSLSSTE